MNDKQKSIIDNNGLLFFFRHKGIIYGASEMSRVMYAKMKDKNDEDNNPAWLNTATFTAVDLSKLLNGKDNQTVFGQKDLDDIKIITDRREIENI